MVKQIKFKSLMDRLVSETEDIHGGILLDNGDCICGCCGSVFPADERGETWEILESYDDYWVNLDEEIIGDDCDNDEE